jgi:hypothetical protein
MFFARRREPKSLYMFTRLRCDRPIHRLLLPGVNPNDCSQQSVCPPDSHVGEY